MTAVIDFLADAAAMADVLRRVGDGEATSLALLPAGALGALPIAVGSRNLIVRWCRLIAEGIFAATRSDPAPGG